MGLTTNVAMLLKSAFTIIGTYVILFVYSWKNTLIAIAFILPNFCVIPTWARLTQFTQKQYQEIKAEQSSVANETVGNVKTVKAFSGESFGIETFNTANKGVYNIGKNMAYYYAVMMAFNIFFIQGGMVGTAYFSGKAVERDELTPGKVASYLLYTW